MGLYVMSTTETGHCRRMENGSAESCLSLLDDQTKGLGEREKCVRFSLYSSDSESSIGKNSDQGGENVNDDDGDGDGEVQSRFNQGKNGAFGSLNSLEEALPNRKGLSSFYDGMSKSYPRLGEASNASSIKAIAKPENSYSRKRKISLALELWSGGESSKRSANAKRKTLAVAVAMNKCPKSTDNPFSEITFSSSSPHYSQLGSYDFQRRRRRMSTITPCHSSSIVSSAAQQTLLRNNSWARAEAITNRIRLQRKFGVFAKGSAYWLEDNDTRFYPGTSDSHFLFAFDLRVERHRELPLPAAVTNLVI